MKLLGRLLHSKKKTQKNIIDTYQESINRVGREQFAKLLKRGLKLPFIAV